MRTFCSILITHLLLHLIFATEDDTEYTTIYSSCNSVTEDGLYYIKPIANEPYILPVICSNGYAMLDGSLDLNMHSIPNFLSSYDYGRFNRYYTISSLDDLSTYRQWLLFADENTKFNIAPNCMECEPGNEFNDNTVYYTDSHTFCFSSAITSGCINNTEAASYHIESCSQCDVGVFPNDDTTQLWTRCQALQLSADHPINHDHISCVAHGLTFHPVISNVRDACTCFKPFEIETISYKIPISDLPLVTLKKNDFIKLGFAIADNIQFDYDYFDNINFNDKRDTNIIYLYNNDFIDGTLRIKQSGTYILMEDIIFNFNAPNDEIINSENFSPNSVDLDELYWFPTHLQADRDGEYPGLYTYSGAFTLGFFAGITIETNYVTIDLNGFTLSQHKLFYFQQRFFSLIEMASQPFVPGQGPANWGAGNDFYAQYVTIKNGNLGLTSHHGIHGNNNNEIQILNINSYNFDVAGIQCNSCDNLLISNCIIGPQNNNIPLLGRYTHSRALLPRLKQLIDDGLGNKHVTFYNRNTQTVSDIINRLINQMDMIYNYINNPEQFDIDDDDIEWIAAQKIFYNPSGWMDGGSSYGLLIGGDGAQVVGIGARHGDTSNVILNNIEIFGIYNRVIEKVKYTANFGATRLIFFDAIDWNAVTSETLISSQSIYYGDVYTDITFAISHVINSWYFMNSLFVSDMMKNFVFSGQAPLDKLFHGGCGSDIQLHSSKGAIGLRIDGTQNLNIDGINIHDIYNWADLGNEEWCGEYEGPNVGNEDIEIQYGYTGTRSHGMVIDFVQGEIKNIQINNIESYNGEANGFTIYKESNIILENVNVDSIHAGTQLTNDDINNLNLPNLIPRACGVDIRPNTEVVINDENIGIITGNDIYGYHTCYDDDDDTTNDDQIINNANNNMNRDSIQSRPPKGKMQSQKERINENKDISQSQLRAAPGKRQTHRENNNDDDENQKKSMLIVFVLFMIGVIIIIGIALKYKYCYDNKDNNNKDLKIKNLFASEFTPLLI